MDIKDFFKAGTMVKKTASNSQERARKEEIRNNIVEYYQDNFVSCYPDMDDLEYAHFRNKEVIQEIANIFERELKIYFSKARYTDRTKVALAILVYKGVYINTTYRKTKATFDLTGYIANCVPDAVRVVVDMLPSKTKKLQALINYADASWDTDTVEQLTEMQDCKLV
jgi:hypothetical protein